MSIRLFKDHVVAVFGVGKESEVFKSDRSVLGDRGLIHY